MASKSASQQLDRGPLAAGERGIHIVCHACAWEGLVLPRRDLDSVDDRAERLVEKHTTARPDHRISTQEVWG